MISKSVIVDGFESIENEQAETDVMRAKNALNEVTNYLDRLLIDWAYWDDAYNFVNDRNDTFIKSNLTVETLLKQNIAFIIFLNNKGDLVWGKQIDAGEHVFVPLSRGMKAAITKPSPLLLEDRQKGFCKGVLVLDNAPYLVSARGILDSDAKEPARGICIMGRLLDKPLINDLARATRLNLGIRKLTPGEKTSVPTGPGETAPRLAKDSDSIVAGTLIRDVHGAAQLELMVKDDRSVMAMGLATFRQNFVWMLVTGMGVGAVFIVLLEVRILRRFRTIRMQADKICHSGKAVRRIAIDGSDELSDLADNFNKILEKIETNETFLQQTLDSLNAGVVLISPEDHRIVDINSFALGLIDLPKEEIVGKLCHGFICPQEIGNCPITDKNELINLSTKKLLTKNNVARSILKSARRVHRDGKELLLETFIDISEQEAAQQALRVSEDKYRAVFMNTGTASILIGPDTTILLANNEFANLSGFERGEIENKMSFKQFFAPDQTERLLQYHQQRRVNPEFAPRTYETVFLNKQQDPRSVHMTVAMVPGTDFSIASILDISERILVEKELTHQAFHDSLTGLPNRLLLHDRIQHAVRLASRESLLVGILLLDIDRFKQINDSFGHPFGDKLLHLVAARLTRAVRTNDTVSRLGGDEFVIVVENPKNTFALAHVAHHILSAFKEPFDVDGHVIYLGVSIGVTSYPQDGDDPASLIKNADLAMYRSKELGKNMYSMFTKELNDQAVSKMALETELHRALENNGFFVVYQPKIDAARNRVVGCEALVRWRNSSGEIVSPAKFIPLAEETGLIVRLDALVLRSACRQVKLWHEQGAPDLTLAVNISARNFQTDTVVAQVVDILRETSFPPHLLEIEITETALMSNWDRAVETITELSRMGIRISLDDFGTGHSSLYYLQKLPISCLKIDKRFIDGISSLDADTTVLINTIITLADNLSLDIVAEGVETQPQLDFLLENGCSIIQGYLFAPPLPAEKFEPLLGKPLQPGTL